MLTKQSLNSRTLKHKSGPKNVDKHVEPENESVHLNDHYYFVSLQKKRSRYRMLEVVLDERALFDKTKFEFKNAKKIRASLKTLIRMLSPCDVQCAHLLSLLTRRLVNSMTSHTTQLRSNCCANFHFQIATSIAQTRATTPDSTPSLSNRNRVP